MEFLFVLLWVGMLFLTFVVYFLPYLIADKRKSEDKKIIFWLTLFLGWTGLIWLALIVWACTSGKINPEKEACSALELDRYHDLLEKGAITKDEYQQKKEEILNLKSKVVDAEIVEEKTK